MPIWRIVSKLFHFESDGKDESDGVTFADTYHGKVVPLEQASQLVTVNQSIDLGDLEQVIPYTRARDIVLLNQDHIVALECPCRASRANPCIPRCEKGAHSRVRDARKGVPLEIQKLIERSVVG